LSIDERLLNQMTDDATELAKPNQQIVAPDNANQDGTFSRASVLPQLVTSLQRILMHWQDELPLVS